MTITKRVCLSILALVLTPLLILLAGMLLVWTVFRRLSKALKTFSERTADNQMAPALHEDLPELSAMLETVQARNQELTALNHKLQEEIGARLRTETELTRVNSELSAILEGISEAFFALDSNWRLTYLNREAEILLGGTREKLAGQVIWNEIPGHENMQAKFREALLKNISLQYEDYGDSSHKWLEIHVYPAPNGLSVFMRDITERKLANEALRASEQRFFKAFYSSPSLMVIIDLENGQILDANESFFFFSGYERAQIIQEGNSLKFCDIFEACFMLESPMGELELVRNSEVTYHTQDGQVRYGLAATEKIELSGKRCLLVAIIDITERKRFEKEMLRYEQLSLVGQMAAGIGHEIRNPMTTVRGFLQMLGAKQDLQAYQEYFSLMIDELDRANAIISEFLSLSRNRPVELQLQSLNAILSALAPLIEADAQNGEKSFYLRLESIPHLLLNDKEIRQIVLNLARNALEAMEPGGVLTLKTYMEEKEVILAVEDNGPGIPADVLTKIGTPFYTTKDQGTGLGLAVCYSIAARHQASMTVQSLPGRTVFAVKFPLPAC